MTFMQHKDFAYSSVAVGKGPSPPASGNSLVVQNGTGSLFPTPPFMATVWPPNKSPLASNAEVIQVNGISGDTFVFARAQENTSAQPIVAGYQIAATITAKPFTDLESLVIPATQSTAGLVRQSTYNVLDYGATGNGITDDHTAFNNAIIACNAAGGGVVYVPKATYIFTTPITMLSNVILRGDGRNSTFLISSMASSNFRGILNINNQTDIVIEDITFNASGGTSGVTSYGHNRLTIRRCGFTGTTTTSNGGILVFVTTTASGATTGCVNSVIEQNYFHDITTLNARTFYILSGNGNDITDVKIINNYFSNNGGPCITMNGTGPVQPPGITQVATAAFVRRVLVQGNSCINVLQGNVVGDITTASLVLAGIGAVNTVFDLTIDDNYLLQTNTATVSGGIAFIYGCYNVTITNNKATSVYVAGSSNYNGGPFVSPGRVDDPCVHMVIADNYCEGFNGFWDPDSMIDVDVHDNIIYGCGRDIFGGYNIQENIRVHDNIIHNSVDRLSSPGGWAVSFQQAPINISYMNNIYIDDRNVQPPTNVAIIVSSTSGTLQNGTTYYYIVTALDGVGETIASSEVSAIPNHGTLKIQWNYSPGAKQYKFYRSKTSGSYTNSLVGVVDYGVPGSNIVNNNLFTDTGFATTTGTPPVFSTVAGIVMNKGIVLTGDASDVRFVGNKFYVPNSTFSTQVLFLTGTESIPSIFDNNEWNDSTGRNREYVSVKGNITGAVTFDPTKGLIQSAIFTGNVTSTMLSGKYIGQIMERRFTMGGNGGYTYTQSANEILAGGSYSPSTGSGSLDILIQKWNGTNWIEISRTLGLAPTFVTFTTSTSSTSTSSTSTSSTSISSTSSSTSISASSTSTSISTTTSSTSISSTSTSHSSTSSSTSRSISTSSTSSTSSSTSTTMLAFQ